MQLLTLVLIVIIIFMIYLGVARYFAPNATLNKKSYLATGVPNVPLKDMPSLGASKYSLELWVYVNQVDAAITYQNTNNVGPANPAGNIFVIPNTLSLDVYKDGSAGLMAGNNRISITDKFPLQRWEHIIINVDNNLVEIYLDGKLLRSVKSKSPIPTPTVDSVLSFGKGDMYIAKFNRNLFTIDQTTAFNNYIGGNNGLRLTNYTISFDFLKNSKTAYNYQLL
jgi:hypothetical protein